MSWDPLFHHNQWSLAYNPESRELILTQDTLGSGEPDAIVLSIHQAQSVADALALASLRFGHHQPAVSPKGEVVELSAEAERKIILDIANSRLRFVTTGADGDDCEFTLKLTHFFEVFAQVTSALKDNQSATDAEMPDVDPSTN